MECDVKKTQSIAAIDIHNMYMYVCTYMNRWQ